MKYDDLLNVPYKAGGRNKSDGLDCYGLCIEMCRRNGKKLKDLRFCPQNEDMLAEDAAKLNVVQIQEEDAEAGDILQSVWNGELHIAYMLDKIKVIHATTSGVRVTPVIAFRERKFFRVV